MFIRMKYLFQKQPNGVYYYRRRVPKRLIEHMDTKVFMVSLKTRKPLEAQAKAKHLTKKLEVDWEKMLKGEQGSLKDAQELLDA